MAMHDGEKKDGVTVKEIENFGKSHRFQIFFCVAFILASFFSFVFFGAAWSIYLAGLGAVVGVWLPKQIGKLIHSVFHFCLKQERVTRYVIAGVGLIVSVFLPLLIFLCIGLIAGRSIHMHTNDSHTE